MFLIVTELNGPTETDPTTGTVTRRFKSPSEVPPELYSNLERAIKALGNWSNRLRGAWLVESRFSASQIRDLLKPHLFAGSDRLFVVRMSKNWAGTGMGEGFQEWMTRRNFDPPTK